MRQIPILHIDQFEHEETLEDFYCNDLALHLRKNNKIVYKPHSHDFFLCVFFSKGSGVHEIDFDHYPVEPGSVFFLRPGQTHCWTFEDTPEGYIFFHTQSFYEFYFSNKQLSQFPFYYSPKNPPNLSLTSMEIQPIEHRFQEIYREYGRSAPYKRQKLVSLVDLSYIDLARIYGNMEPVERKTSTTYLETLNALEKAIESAYKTEKSAAFYADQLHITPKHLNRIVKTTLNKTTTELIADRVFLEAKRLIVHSGNTLSTIAILLGYEDYAYFSKVFKQRTGMTPLGFKKKYK
ncbi:AraC family transcriptional regulator [Spongiimicrobium salis]|uniref:AraC family transcriptional regulator n=1 Tax=Spongiimicrobium salis TaxID=1667022 RepID=UPI00374CD13C